MREPVQKLQRCAIYTRKSTEHNLDLAFNSLDAQREACEAYIKSQAHEGWRLVPAHFDDGGLSGASLERPALQHLLDKVRSGSIDIIVVYKVDRLTRSLADFAKLVELFDTHGVSFVSVTQSFNTTSSMGRLTLNVLLSFAQFEREVIGERVRDKIAASKRRGLWMGGHVPLGYRNENKRLVIEDDEADLVRRIFRLYLELGSVGAVVEALDREGVRSRNGYRFSVGAIAHLLKDRVFMGEVAWKGEVHKGEHEAIIDGETFSAVQERLAQRSAQRRNASRSSAFLLAGLLYDDAGHRMSPSHAYKAGVRYRYYVSQALLQHRKAEAGTIARISAPEVEEGVTRAFPFEKAELGEHITSITLHRDHLAVQLKETEDEPYPEPISLPFVWQPQGRRKGIIHEPDLKERLDPKASKAILTAIGKARRWMTELLDGSATIDAIASREGMGDRNVRRLLALACLSPRLIKAIADGNAPADLTVTSLTVAPPHDWAAQEQRILGA